MTRISFAHAEHFHGLLAQILADRGDAVGLLDGEFGDGEIGGVHAHQRDIGAVQRGDEGQPAHGGQHLLRQQGGDGMRDGVVHVQHVEVVALGHLRHARGQRQAVGRVLEQRVGRDLDLVVVDARRVRVQPDGVGVGDEVDLVAAGGQFQAEFGGDDAAAAVSGIAGDSDVHLASVAKADLPVQVLVRARPRRRRRTRPGCGRRPTTTVGSQITFEFHGCGAGEDGGEFAPSARRRWSGPGRRRRFSARSRPVYSIQ